MAFRSSDFNLLIGTLGGGPLRIWAYATADAYDTVVGANYFVSAYKSKISVGDIIIVRQTTGGSYELLVTEVSQRSVVVVDSESDGYVRASWFGDGFAGLQKAWAVSKRVRCTPGVDYIVPADSYLTSDGEDVHIDAQQSRFVLSEVNNRLCRLRGGWEDEQSVSAIAGAVITVENGGVYARGDVLKLFSEAPLPEFVRAGRMGEFVEVSSVSGNDVTLMKVPYYTYDTGDDVRVSRLKSSLSIRVDIGEIAIPIEVNSGASAVQIYAAHNPAVVIGQVPVLPEGGFAVRFVSTLGGEALFEAIGTARTSGGAREGYGIEFHNCEHGRARVQYAGGGTRHVIDGGGGTGGDGAEGPETYGASAYNKVYNSLAVGTAAAPYQCHHGVRQLLFEDCTAVGCRGDFTTRGVGTIFRRCISYSPQDVSFGAFEQFDASECNTDDTRYEQCRIIGGQGSMFNPLAGSITIDGGEFELSAGGSTADLVRLECDSVVMVNRPRFVINGNVLNRVVYAPATAMNLALVDFGDSYWKLTQAATPDIFFETMGGVAPVLKWEGLTIDGAADSFNGLFGESSLPAVGSKLGNADIHSGFAAIVKDQPLSAVSAYLTGTIRNLASRRELRRQVNSFSLGTMTTGTLTLDPTIRLLHYTNGGAHTLAPPTADCDLEVLISNNASAGAITTSGWSHVRGDSFTTTNLHRFLCRVRRVGGSVSILVVTALQ